MKKAAGIVIKILLGLILLILVLLFTVPILFKDKIRTTVEQVINESVNATVKFDDYNLSFFRNFPNLAFSMKNLSVVGVDEFSKDTLAGFKSFDFVFDLSSLFKKTGYEVKSVIMDRAVVNAVVLKGGKANWDIVKDTTTTTEVEEEETGTSTMKIQLKKVALLQANIAYKDYDSDMQAFLNNLNFELSGDMTMSETDLQMTLNVADFTFIMEGMKYMNKAVLDSKIDLLANLDNMKFTFGENYFAINDMRLNFSGTIAMPGDDIETDVQFNTPQTSFKTLLSLVPAFYMNDYKDLKATGDFSISGTAKGVYSDADSTLPDVTLNMTVNNGLISYPDLPEQIQNINIKAGVDVDGKNLDGTTVDVSLFHLELAGSPFDMTFGLKTPMSDPDFKASLKGKVDLSALSKAVPMDSISISGIIDMAVEMAGKLSMVEKEQYESFQAVGNMNITDMLIAMTGYPEVRINQAGFTFTPAYTTMTNTNLNVGGKSDFRLDGRLENYIPYVFSDGTIKGSLSLKSKLIDVSEIMSKMAMDTTTSVEDTTSLAIIQVPKNIDFNFDALIDNFSYDSIKAQNIKAKLIVKEGVLSIRDAGMNILNGSVQMNADYDTRDTLKPVMKADFNMKNIGIRDAFKTFNTVQKLAPAAKNIDGRVNASLNYVSLLGSDMMPVVNSINGAGKFQSDQITLLESKTFDKLKGVLHLGDKYNNTFKDVNVSFKIADGRIYVSPFDVKAGDLKMNISGDQGLDQTINYIVKTEVPRTALGGAANSLINNLTSQAASYGVAFKPSDVIKVSVKVTGTFKDPQVAPFFGKSEGGESAGGGVKEAVKETVKQTVSNAVDEGKEKAKVEAEAQAAKIVQEAEQRAQQIRDEAAKGAAKIREEAAAQAQKVIDAASSKGPIAKLAAQKSADQINKTADTKANQLVQEGDVQANKVVEEAKAKSQAIIDKI
ncbi:MAG TPA: AsmA-like C-terminal region-containing protein [Bacteroidales bacterium]|nr:AsmA-like C-terminal region-containing protein [Bacteroidales bacterium]